MADDDELDLETGGKDSAGGTADKKKRGRPTRQAQTSDLKTTIQEGLDELSNWLGDGEIGTAVRDGAPRMAKVLAARAARHARVERALRIIFATDGPLAILRAFGPAARALGKKLGALRDRDVEYVDDAGYLVDPDTGQRILDEATGQPIAGQRGNA